MPDSGFSPSLVKGSELSQQEQNYRKMTQTPVPRLILQLGIPTTVSMLITNIYNMADTYFVGMLGESAQAATGVLFTLQAIIQGIAFMLGHGSGSFISKHLANRDPEKASQYISTAFFTGAFVGIGILTLGLTFLTPLMRLLGSTDTILPHAKDYGFWILLACPFIMCSLILNNALRYEGKAFFAMLALTTGGILNIFGDYLLVYKLEMGVYGAGLATAVSQAISFFLLLLLFSKMALSRIRLRCVSRDFRVYLSILRVGLPSFIRQSLSAATSGIMNNMTKPFGDASIAAMSVVHRFSMFLMSLGLGIGQGFQPVAAFNYQAKKYDRVKKGLVFTMLFCFVFIGALCMASLFFAERIITLFQSQPDVVRIGSTALRYTAIGLLFTGISVPVNMLYQSIQKPAVSSVLSLIRSGGVSIPVLLLVPILGLTAIQVAQPAGDVVAGFISIPFIFHFLCSTPRDPQT